MCVCVRVCLYLLHIFKYFNIELDFDKLEIRNILNGKIRQSRLFKLHDNLAIAECSVFLFI